jgi:glyoxylase-like metal-dependent hydrolase (beta-lactamase superfamily II)
MTRKPPSISVAALILVLFGPAHSVNAEVFDEYGLNRVIEQVSESVYRWGSDNQYGAYIVGSKSIAVVDGHYCQSGTVDWLKEEIRKRHDVPVRYVVLSHDHPDHICGSQAFSDTATGVGHTNLVPHIVRENRPSIIPDITFDTSMAIDLGGVSINLLYFGPSHSDNLIQVHIPEEKVLVAIDMAKGRSIFPDYRDMDVHGMLKVQKQLAMLDDVEIVLPGHGNITDQENFRDSYKFIKALRDEVLAMMVDGKSLNEIRDVIKMDDFSDYRNLDRFLDANIVTMWDYLYRYREPNRAITPAEAVMCREDSADCRTNDTVD